MRHDRFIMGAALAALFLPLSAVGNAASESVELLKRLEGFRPSAYLCQAGELAIGYGFTDQRIVSRGTISRAEADRELKRLCDSLLRKIRMDLKGRSLTDTQTAAIVSFAYNVGWGTYRTSTVRRMILQGRRGADVAEEIRKWVFVTQDGRKIRSRGLQKRRLTEALMFAR